AAAVPGARARVADGSALAEEVRAADLVVNATPVGRDAESTLIPPDMFEERHIVVDLVYHPETTPLVRQARERGATAHNGLGMLVHQAVLSFEAWTGIPAPIGAMRAAAAD